MQCLFLCVIGGLAGCYAAIAAARHGKSVVLVKEIAEAYVNEQDGCSNGIGHYIECREGSIRLDENGKVVKGEIPKGYFGDLETEYEKRNQDYIRDGK